MRIPTNANDVDFELIALSPIDPATVSPVKVYGKDDVQLVDGAPVYRLPDLVVKVDGRIDRSVSVKFRSLPKDKVAELSVFHLSGQVVITPYLSDADHRIHYSVLADGLVA